MLPETDEAAIQADAYIDALLSGHARSLSAIEAGLAAGDSLAPEPSVRDAIHLLERGLPRFHPSFLFEEWLADQLRRAAAAPHGGPDSRRSSEIIPLAVIPPLERSMHGLAGSDRRLADRRLLVGGAIASGVSIAGAAVIAWRRSRN